MSASDERGEPRTGLPVGVRPAPWGARLGAGLLDLVVPVILIVIAVMINSIGWTFVLLVVAIAWWVLTWATIGRRATSLGLRVTGLQVVGLRDGRPVGFGRSALRGIVQVVLIGTGIGLIVLLVPMFRSPRRQGAHDLVADAVVIRARALAPAEPPIDDEEPAAEPFSADEVQAGEVQAAEVQADEVHAAETPVAQASVGDAPVAGVAGAADHADPGDQPDAVVDGATRDEEPLGPPPPDQGWRGLLDDQLEFRIGHLVLLGRQPTPRDGEEDAELIKVSDPARTVSKTHVAIDVDARGPYATDRGSTNGTAVTDPDGRYTLLVEGEPHRLALGDVIAFGDHRVEVVRVEPGEATDPGSAG